MVRARWQGGYAVSMTGKQIAFLLLVTLLVLVLVDFLLLFHGGPFRIFYLTNSIFMIWLAWTAFKGQVWALVVFVGLSLPYAILQIAFYGKQRNTVAYACARKQTGVGVGVGVGPGEHIGAHSLRLIDVKRQCAAYRHATRHALHVAVAVHALQKGTKAPFLDAQTCARHLTAQPQTRVQTQPHFGGIGAAH